jgi:hypothetical protein
MNGEFAVGIVIKKGRRDQRFITTLFTFEAIYFTIE